MLPTTLPPSIEYVTNCNSTLASKRGKCIISARLRLSKTNKDGEKRPTASKNYKSPVFPPSQKVKRAGGGAPWYPPFRGNTARDSVATLDNILKLLHILVHKCVLVLSL